MVFIVSLESFECQNHRIFDKNKLRKALCLVARFVSFYYNSSGQAVSRRYFFHACWHGLCGFLALCRCFLQIFVSFIICFLRIVFSIAMESPASFLDGFILSQKTALVSEKSKKSRIYFRSFHPPLAEVGDFTLSWNLLKILDKQEKIPKMSFILTSDC